MRSSYSSHRLAGGNSLQSGVPMSPLTRPGAFGEFANALSRVGKINFPKGEQFLKQIVDTHKGPIVMTMAEMFSKPGQQAAELIERVGTTLNVNRQPNLPNNLVTVNPQVLSGLQNLGRNLKGIAAVDFDWHPSLGYKSMQGPPGGFSRGDNLKITKSIEDAFHNKIVPVVQHLNPGKTVWLQNDPTTLSRAKLYSSDYLPHGRAMGPLDPTGMQHSLILPSGRTQGIELLGGPIPSNLLSWLEKDKS